MKYFEETVISLHHVLGLFLSRNHDEILNQELRGLAPTTFNDHLLGLLCANQICESAKAECNCDLLCCILLQSRLEFCMFESRNARSWGMRRRRELQLIQ